VASGTCALLINMECYELQESGLVKSNSKYFVIRECFDQKNKPNDEMLETTKFQFYDIQALRNTPCDFNALVAEFEVCSVATKWISLERPSNKAL
jgi:hypothetical protein